MTPSRYQAPLAICLPSGEMAIALMEAGALIVLISFPLSKSHTRMLWSTLPETSRVHGFPFSGGTNATLLTEFVCPWRVFSSLPVSASQTLIVFPPPLPPMYLPSGEYTRQSTLPSCDQRAEPM